jgi:hypothetical protein
MRIGYLIKIAAALVALSALASMALVFRWHSNAQSAVTIVGAVLFAILAIAAFIAWPWLFQVRAKSIVQKWAAGHRYTILHLESPFYTGAFSFWSTSRAQVVYSVTIRDREGLERRAWVRCGRYRSGVFFSDEIEVTWSDEPKAA